MAGKYTAELVDPEGLNDEQGVHLDVSDEALVDAYYGSVYAWSRGLAH